MAYSDINLAHVYTVQLLSSVIYQYYQIYTTGLHISFETTFI
uniref:Uncharacterized protein n=1 Tax=Anguilla anguilla TaxID=7936 RepID=A0A0E9T0G0_ANGAN